MKFEVGERVRIKTAKEMVESYGLDEYKDLKVEYGFIDMLEGLFGKSAIITNSLDGQEKTYCLEDENTMVICEENMIEDIKKEDMKFQIGEKVLIKDREELIETYGMDRIDDIDKFCQLSATMDICCGGVVTIADSWKDGDTNRYEIKEDIWFMSYDCDEGVFKKLEE